MITNCEIPNEKITSEKKHSSENMEKISDGSDIEAKIKKYADNQNISDKIEVDEQIGRNTNILHSSISTISCNETGQTQSSNELSHCCYDAEQIRDYNKTESSHSCSETQCSRSCSETEHGPILNEQKQSDILNEIEQIPMCSVPVLNSPIDNSLGVPLYITMNHKNLKKYKHLVRPVYNSPLLVFDIDNTLYTSRNGLEDEVRRLLVKGLREILWEQGEDKISDDDLLKCMIKLCEIYGLSSRGALKEFNIQLQCLIKNFNLIDFGKFVEKDDKLRQELENIKMRKICFTNAGMFQAKKVLSSLGVEDCFDVIITADTDASPRNNFRVKHSNATGSVSKQIGEQSNASITSLLDQGEQTISSSSLPMEIQKKNVSNITAAQIKKFLEMDIHDPALVAFDANDDRDFICKPFPEAYRFIEEMFTITTTDNLTEKVEAGGNSGSTLDENNSQTSFGTIKNVLFFDDALRNVVSANDHGWQAVHVLNEKHIVELIKESIDVENRLRE